MNDNKNGIKVIKPVLPSLASKATGVSDHIVESDIHTLFRLPSAKEIQSEKHDDHLYDKTGVPSEFMPVLQKLSQVMNIAFRSFYIEELDPQKASSIHELEQTAPFMNNAKLPKASNHPGHILKAVKSFMLPAINNNLTKNPYKSMKIKAKSSKNKSGTIAPGCVIVAVRQSLQYGKNNNDIIKINDIHAKKHHISHADLISILGNTVPNYPVVELKNINDTGKLQIKYKEGSEILSCWIDANAFLNGYTLDVIILKQHPSELIPVFIDQNCKTNMYVAALEDNELIYPDLDVLFYAIDVEMYPANAQANSFNNSIKDDSGHFNYKKSQYAIYADGKYQPKDLLEALKYVSNEFTNTFNTRKNQDPIFHELQNLALSMDDEQEKIIIPKDGNIFSWAASIYEQLSDDNKKIYHDLGAMELYAVAIKIITDQLIPGLNPIRHGPESNTPVYAEEMLYMLLTKRKDSLVNNRVDIIKNNFEQTIDAEQLFDNYIAKLNSKNGDKNLVFGIHPVWIDKYPKADELIKLMIKNICDKQIQKPTFAAQIYLDRIMFEMQRKKLEFITFHMKAYPNPSEEQKAKYNKEIAHYDFGINQTHEYIQEAINELNAQYGNGKNKLR